MAPPLSLAQSSFLLSSLLSDPPHRLDQRPLLGPRPLVLAPPVESGAASISLGETSLSCKVSTRVVKASEKADEDDQADAGAAESSAEDEAAGGLWTISLQTSPSCEVPLRNGGNSSATGNVELDASLEMMAHLLRRHLVATLPVQQFIILDNPLGDPASSSSASSSRERLRGATFWNISIDVSIHSMSGGNLYDAIWACVYAALYRTRVPRTREIAYLPPQSAAGKQGTAGSEMDVEEIGIKSLKGRAAKGRAIDFELVDVWEEGVPLLGREALGVGLTLGLLPNGTNLLDPGLDEELCLPSSRRLFIVASPPTSKSSQGAARLHLTHLLPSLLNLTAGEASESASATSTEDQQHNLRFPSPPTKSEQWEASGWGIPDYSRLRGAIGTALPLAGQLAVTLRQTLETEEAGLGQTSEEAVAMDHS